MDRYGSVETFRGVCAIMVALGAWLGLGGRAGAAPLHLFADFFLLLTGFIVARVYRDRIESGPSGGPGAARFLLLRLARIYPLHIFLLALFVAVETGKLALQAAGVAQFHTPGFAGSQHSLEGFGAHLVLLQALSDTPSWNVASWILSVEFLLCLLFAALCLTGVTRSATGRLALAFSACGALAWVAGRDAGAAITGADALARGYGAFMTGVLVHSAAQSRRATRWMEANFGPPGAVIEAASLSGLVLFLIAGAAPVLAVPIFALVLFVFQYELSGIARAIGHRGVRGLGALAYPLLISHFLIVQPVAGIVAGDPAAAAKAALATPLYLALTLAIAVVCALYVEAPTRDAMRLWIGRWFEPGLRLRPAPARRHDGAEQGR